MPDHHDAMTELLALTPDELLTTTRAVRKRLDLEREVPLEVIYEALEIAVQAPSGSNRQGWQWIVVTDPDVKRQIAAYYRRSWESYSGVSADAAPDAVAEGGTEPATVGERIRDSSAYLARVMGEVPVLVIGAITVDEGGELPASNQAGLWGSLLPAAWNFALALRARGLGTTWTTLHLQYEREVAQILGLPSNIRQGVLLPVAYTIGTEFRPGPRADFDAIVHINHW